MMNLLLSISGSEVKEVSRLETIRILILPCANGYDYSTHNMDLDPLIEEILEKDSSFTIIPFPYKTMMGVPYQGVFDKKYCPPIIGKVDVDIIIMNKFEGELFSKKRKGLGYRIRILNTNTMEQFESVRGNNLSSYEVLKTDLNNKEMTLISDVQKAINSSYD